MDHAHLSDIDDYQAEAAADMLAALANPRRLMILCSLVEGEKSVGELNEHIPLSQSALSQHLARLRNENLVTTRRESQTIYYRISEPAVYDIIARLHERFCKTG
jgi:ArsR family transcriptional regulator, virulence genes transcriptional regulator